jgi:lipopolysaccharide transport system ATP-binding protein
VPAEPAPELEAVAPPPSAVELIGVTKRYPLFSRRRDRALGLLGWTSKLAHKTALEDVTLAMRHGEAVGIIGENGSGKSTMLRVVAGATDADAGTVTVSPPVAAILELGLGFHPEFTGRENAFLYGALVGVPHGAMDDRLAEVLAFADLGEFVNMPLRTYSSGMAARLAFAVATNVDARVLVVDEALAVGDGAFQKKCVDRMVRFREEGRTVLFCSHSMYLVTSFCSRAVWLKDGRVAADGEADRVVAEYQRFLLRRGGTETGPGLAVGGEARARLSTLSAWSPSGRAPTALEPRDGLVLCFEIEGSGSPVSCHLGMVLLAEDGRCVLGTSTHLEGIAPLQVSGKHVAELRIPVLPLAGGTYTVKAYLLDESGLLAYDEADLDGGICVQAPAWSLAMVVVDHEWVLAP